MKQPLVSVIIPCYNYGHLIGETIESVINQTYSNWECLIINDGSTDNSLNIIKSLCENDSRVKYFDIVNGGQARARNYGIKQSKGDYIQFLDADDLLQNDKLLNQLNFLEANKTIDIVYSGIRYFDPKEPGNLLLSRDGKNRNYFPLMSGAGIKILEKFIYQNPIELGAILFRKKTIEETGIYFDELMNGAEDWDFCFKMALANCYFKYKDMPYAYILMRYHPTSYSSISPNASSAYSTLKSRMLPAIMEKKAFVYFNDKEKALFFFGKHMLSLLSNKKYLKSVYHLIKLSVSTREFRYYIKLYMQKLT